MSFYFYQININPQEFKGLRTLFDYKTGIIGDVIILPLINILVFYVIRKSKLKISGIAVFFISLFALTSDFLMNFIQGYFKLINWSMPHPYDWNFAGRWHLISLFFQLAYLYFFFYVLFKSSNRKDKAVKISAITVFILLGIFIALFLDDYILYFLRYRSIKLS